MHRLKASYVNMLGTALLVLSTIGVFGMHAISGDEGVVLNMAWQLLQGREWYTQVIEYLPPITPFIAYLTWLFTGAARYVPVLTVFMGIWLLTASYMVYWLQKQAVRPIIAWLAVFAWLAISGYHVLINHNSLSALFSIITTLMWLGLRFGSVTDKHNNTYDLLRCVAIGTGIAFVILTLHTKGLMLAITIGFMEVYWLVRGRVKTSKQLAVIIMSAVIIVLQVLWWWDANTLWQAFVILPQANAYVENTFYTLPGILWLCVITLVMGLLVWRSHSLTATSQLITTLSIMQIAMLVSSWYIIDTAHMWLAAWPLLVAIALHLDDWTTRQLTKKQSLYVKRLANGKYVTTWRVALLIWPFLPFLVLLLLRLLMTLQWHVDMYITGEIISGEDKIRTIHNASVFAGPFAPSIYYELGKDNPYVYTHNLVLCNSACVDNTLAVLEAERPDFVYWSHWTEEKMQYKPTTIDDYIDTNYVKCDDVSATRNASWLARKDLACPE